MGHDFYEHDYSSWRHSYVGDFIVRNISPIQKSHYQIA